MKLCLSQCCSIYLYIDNVRARKSLSEKWYGKSSAKLLVSLGVVQRKFAFGFLPSLKIYGIVRALVL